MRIFKWYYKNAIQGYVEKRMQRNPTPIYKFEYIVIYIIATIIMPIALPIDILIEIVHKIMRYLNIK